MSNREENNPDVSDDPNVEDDLEQIRDFARTQITDIFATYGDRPALTERIVVALANVLVAKSYQAGMERFASTLRVTG